jgi:hypothetical protein
MKQTIGRHLVPLILLIGLSADAFAQSEEASMAGFQFLDYPPSVRQIGLGFAGTALGGSGFAGYNPASPMLTDRPYLNIGYAPLPAEYTIASCEGAWTFSNMFVGANFTNHFIGGIIPADFNDGPNYNVPGSYDGSAFSVCFGFKREDLGLGLAVTGLQERIVSYTSYGICVSAGLAYWLVPQKLTLGAAVLNVGTTTGGLDDTRFFGEGAPLPRSGRAGAAYSDTLFRIAYTVTGDVVYRDVGNKVTSASQIFNRMTVPVGIEAWPTQYVALRVGKRFNYETELFSFGGGLRFAMLSFDLAFTLTSLVSDLEVDPYLSLTYTLTPPRQPAAKPRKSSSQPIIIQQPAEVKGAAPLTAPPKDTAGVPSQKTIGAGATAHSDSSAVLPAKTDSTASPKSVDRKAQTVPAAKDTAAVPSQKAIGAGATAHSDSSAVLPARTDSTIAPKPLGLKAQADSAEMQAPPAAPKQ